MAKNESLRYANHITIPVALLVGPNSPPLSGDPVVCGRIAGVANTTGVVGGSIAVTIRGVYTFSVSSVHNGVSLGETVFIDPATGVLSDDLADVPFGTALGTVAAGQTASIPILLFGSTPGATGAGS